MAPQPRRVLAHPLRSRLVAHLRLEGGATSAELARALDTNTGATSYHLRVLEGAGLVEDTGLGNAKTRVWALVEDDDAEPDLPTDPDELAADRWLEHDYVDHFAERSHALIDAAADWPAVWQELLGLRDKPLLMTGDQATAFAAELDELLERYRRIGAGSPGARRLVAYAALLPVDPPA
ncbi:helix-turn-helix domain-containing protein [Calidifontibacter sp. DB0510]|uniref:Helix-turn-helix domain-containing protein n=1 Tax=Metallococcus carri TaxID=1656884 RepID=A0A967AZC3_9MICO|nr:helix-turn-helix domain-containing protein [Metallococcus carri]NHN55149.1 helix-turn-helix domain-containing protein [Metallococcus carri]NOP36226.1 helix-turn-helix domain-containing protein [Calidifontibacter sp. DB2511S]